MKKHRFVKECSSFVQARARACKLMDPWIKQGIIYRCSQAVNAYEHGNISEMEAIETILNAYKREDENE